MINWNETLKTAHISDDGLYRYTLSRVWDRSKPMILWIMLNPSTADGKQDDRTIRKIGKFSDDFGFGGMWVGNLFAYRSKDPAHLINFMKNHEGSNKEKLEHIVGPDNDKHIKFMVSKSKKVILGWGTNALEISSERVNVVINMFDKAYALTMNSDNSPGHPLYTSGATKLFQYK